MAEQEMAPAQDTAAHVRDYSRFTKMLKWSTIACAIIAFAVVLIIS